MGVCHCGMCRRWTGGVYMYTSIEPASLELSGGDQLRFYASSDFGERGFCSNCGSSLFWRMRDGSGMEVAAQALDDPSSLPFTAEIWMDDKPANYSFANPTRKSPRDEATSFGESAGG
ncbi:GFA family protein [Hansschlegelia quercus]|nr:GFA family protein [Hansschlegelia quercus]